MGKLWTDINAILDTRHPADSRNFPGEWAPGGCTQVVARVREGRAQLLDPASAHLVTPPSRGRCRLALDGSDALHIYLFLPPGITREGLRHVFAEGPCRSLLARMAVLGLHLAEENSSAPEQRLLALKEELDRFLEELAPGTVYCRDVADPERDVPDTLVISALAITGSVTAAAVWIRDGLEAQGYDCTFAWGDLLDRIRRLDWLLQSGDRSGGTGHHGCFPTV